MVFPDPAADPLSASTRVSLYLLNRYFTFSMQPQQRAWRFLPSLKLSVSADQPLPCALFMFVKGSIVDNGVVNLTQPIQNASKVPLFARGLDGFPQSRNVSIKPVPTVRHFPVPLLRRHAFLVVLHIAPILVDGGEELLFLADFVYQALPVVPGDMEERPVIKLVSSADSYSATRSPSSSRKLSYALSQSSLMGWSLGV